MDYGSLCLCFTLLFVCVSVILKKFTNRIATLSVLISLHMILTIFLAEKELAG